MTALRGPVDHAQVEDAITDLVRAWIDTYLVRVERRAGDEPRTLARPASWRVDDELRIFQEDVLPLLVVVSAGEAEPPEDDGDGTVAATLNMGAGIYVGDADREHVRVCTRRYGAAVAELLAHKAALVDGCQLVGEPQQAFDELRVPDGVSMTLGVAYVRFRLRVEQIRDRFDTGPEAPYPAPETGDPLPEDPDGLPLDPDRLGVTVEHIQ